MSPERTKIWYLKNLDIFSHMRAEEYRMLDRLLSMREVKKGYILYLQGASDKNFYILKKGAVKITKLTPQGNELILDIFASGTVFGEIPAMEPRERNESAVVVEDGLICIMRKEDFDNLVQVVPGLAVRVNKMIGLKRRKIENKLIDLLYRTVEQRLARTFLNLLDDFGVPHGKGYLLKIKLTHKDYADLIASTRETVTAALNKLKNDGLIDFEGKYIVIGSLEKIADLAA
jgi:CRP/FNR family transcriptional regulator, cyclic AMP receptor protein